MFKFKQETHLNIYICGPTVYSDSHLGHARTYITFDILTRILKYFNQTFTLAMNITDIDDKIIHKFTLNRGTRSMDDYIKFARHHENRFHEDMKSLNIIPPNIITRVTEFIPKIIEFIKIMQDNGFAYEYDGSIWYNHTQDTVKFGKKWVKPPEDFVLWKKRKDIDDNIYFPSVFGEGRPGWHIECSTMATSLFGNNLHIHGGGEDLAFPHHHNEDIQVKAYYNKSSDWNWVHTWMHVGRLDITDSHGVSRKMGKSLKNFITIRDYLKDHSPQSLRLMFLETNYRKHFNYNDIGSPAEAEKKERQISNFLKWATQLPDSMDIDPDIDSLFEEIKMVVISSLKLMDTHDVMQHLYKLQNESVRLFSSKTKTLDSNCKFLLEITSMLGLDFTEYYTVSTNDKMIHDLYHQLKLFIKVHAKKDIQEFKTDVKKITADTSSERVNRFYNEILLVLDNHTNISSLIKELYSVLDIYRDMYKIGDFILD